MSTSNITPAAMFRSIEKFKPTLLIDEYDRSTKDNQELIGVINAGHTKRAGFVIRTVKNGDDHEPKKFNVYGPKVLAGIGNISDTIEDRSFIITLKRKHSGESIEKLRNTKELIESFRTIKMKCVRWSMDNKEALQSHIVDINNGIKNDRAWDNWSALLPIAHVLGTAWEKSALSIARELSTQEEAIDDSIGLQLLQDVFEAFTYGLDFKKMSTQDILLKLKDLPDRPWSTYGARQGRTGGLTGHELGKLLKPFINRKTKQMKIRGINIQGYEWAWFEDALKRYPRTE
jgi:putative DNA primase/helicase